MPRVSRQMAPWTRVSRWHEFGEGRAYRLTADVGVPDLGVEAHLRGLERVVVGDHNIDHELAAGIWAVWWSGDGALEVEQVRLGDWLCKDA